MSDQNRLKAESGFQDAREAVGGSPRKFQHLIREEHSCLIRELGNVDNMLLLTMGCATGGVTPFARQGAWTLGIDISSNALSELTDSIRKEQLTENAHVAMMDCENLALAPNVFDAILFFGVLHHLDIERTMLESYRVLKPGGKIFMSEPLGLHPLVNLYRMITPSERTRYEHPLKIKDFKTMQRYFHIESIRSFCLTSIFALIPLYLFKNNQLYEKTRSYLIRLDEYLFRFLPVLRHFAWSAVVVLRK